MPDLNRTHLLDLLGRFGDSDDATVLAAARELSRTVAEAGLGWEQLLSAEVGGNAPAPKRVESGYPAATAQGDVGRIVERLLARTDISDTLRSDLTDFRKQIAEGKLDKDDADYVRALAKRLD